MRNPENLPSEATNQQTFHLAIQLQILSLFIVVSVGGRRVSLLSTSSLPCRVQGEKINLLHSLKYYSNQRGDTRTFEREDV